MSLRAFGRIGAPGASWRGAISPSMKWRLYAVPGMAPLRRSRGGAFMPILDVDPIRTN